MYVKFSENRWDEIQEAEGNSKNALDKYDELKKEFIDKFWKDDISFEKSAEEINPIG